TLATRWLVWCNYDRSYTFLSPLTPPPPSHTLFPYTTLFRSTPRQKSFRCAPGGEEIWKNGSVSSATSSPVSVPITGDEVALLTRSEEHTSELQSRGHLV